MNNSKARKTSPDKKFFAETNGALLNAVSRQNATEKYSLDLNKHKLRKPEIFRWSSDSKAVGMFITLGIPYDAGGFMSSKTNYWIGIWYPFQNEFFTVHFPEQAELEKNYDPIDSIEVLADEKTVVCSIRGEEFKRVKMPEEPMLSDWEAEKQSLENAVSETSEVHKKEWTWNHTADGYEGVHLYENQIVWFQHENNPHAGGAATEQSFEDFLANGAACFIPRQFFHEFYEAVKFYSKK